MNDFDGRVVVITGAAGNLGRAVTDAFSSARARVALIDISVSSLTDQSSATRSGSLTIAADILDRKSVFDAIDAVLHAFGKIDVLCNLAGGFRMGPPVHETPPDSWRFLMDLNATSIINLSAAVVPAMIANRRGKIVNVAAQAGLTGKAGMGPYSASKSAVIRLTESMSAELKESGINVNCVMPSIIDTPQNRADMPTAEFARWVTPAALAETILFLSSDSARAIHGAAVPVYGLS
jgi:NAD(P)-dependent dehydrogenase (short-subunit alcohol dehydrogenase family)